MKSKNRNFDATVHGDEVIIRAAHPVAKQLFFGWGSDQNAVDISFYGQEDPTDTWRGNFDFKRWQWTLSLDGVWRMSENIRKHIDDRNYYKKSEVKKARELLHLLEKIETEMLT